VKYTAPLIIFLFVLFFICISPLQALELDVEEDLLDFTAEWELTEPQLELLRNPFSDYRAPEPEPTDTPPEEDREEVREEPQIDPPNFTIQGVVNRRGVGTVIIIADGDETILLRQGEVHDGFEFTHYEEGQAYFFKEHKQFRLSPGGGVDEGN